LKRHGRRTRGDVNPDDFLSSRIDVNHEEMFMFDDCLEQMETCAIEMKDKDLEANPQATDAV
jgi:hypothetical protein